MIGIYAPHWDKRIENPSAAKKSSQDLRIYVEISWTVSSRLFDLCFEARMCSGAHTVRQVDISPAKFTTSRVEPGTQIYGEANELQPTTRS